MSHPRNNNHPNKQHSATLQALDGLLRSTPRGVNNNDKKRKREEENNLSIISTKKQKIEMPTTSGVMIDNAALFSQTNNTFFSDNTHLAKLNRIQDEKEEANHTQHSALINNNLELAISDHTWRELYLIANDFNNLEANKRVHLNILIERQLDDYLELENENYPFLRAFARLKNFEENEIFILTSIKDPSDIRKIELDKRVRNGFAALVEIFDVMIENKLLNISYKALGRHFNLKDFAYDLKGFLSVRHLDINIFMSQLKIFNTLHQNDSVQNNETLKMQLNNLTKDFRQVLSQFPQKNMLRRFDNAQATKLSAQLTEIYKKVILIHDEVAPKACHQTHKIPEFRALDNQSVKEVHSLQVQNPAQKTSGFKPSSQRRKIHNVSQFSTFVSNAAAEKTVIDTHSETILKKIN